MAETYGNFIAGEWVTGFLREDLRQHQPGQHRRTCSWLPILYRGGREECVRRSPESAGGVGRHAGTEPGHHSDACG